MTAEGRTPERAAAEWFIALREDPGDAALRTRFTAWLDADPRHAEAWAEMGETARIISAAPLERRAYDVPASIPGHGLAWRRGRHRAMANPRRFLKRAAVAAAVACLALVAAPTLLLRLSADHISGVGEVETIRLADGSTIELGPDSAIAVDYDSGGRGIRLLSGQAMFEVRRDPARPFSVTARDVTTTVLGTGFEVRMIGDATSVAVRHGRVRVEDGESTRELGAGDWVRIAPGALLSAGAGTPELVGAWRGGKVPVRNRPIAEAIDEMRPWYNGKIVLADRALGEKLVTGSYDFHDPARSLDLIIAPYGGRVVRITPWLMIVTGG
ncbi:FecR family protein [Novosphingobium resinovorum]|uniref:FecR family protein n=1 Tax=Novosphingobium resinovorum TaxID=158500 RepID=UPI002ED552BA